MPYEFMKTVSIVVQYCKLHYMWICLTGRQFDKDGNMMQWWNNATIRAFRERTQCMIDQYSRYKVDEVGLYVNGRMTQGENIADNGGLKQSFRVSKIFTRVSIIFIEASENGWVKINCGIEYFVQCSFNVFLTSQFGLGYTDLHEIDGNIN